MFSVNWSFPRIPILYLCLYVQSYTYTYCNINKMQIRDFRYMKSWYTVVVIHYKIFYSLLSLSATSMFYSPVFSISSRYLYALFIAFFIKYKHGKRGIFSLFVFAMWHISYQIMFGLDRNDNWNNLFFHCISAEFLNFTTITIYNNNRNNMNNIWIKNNILIYIFNYYFLYFFIINY